MRDDTEIVNDSYKLDTGDIEVSRLQGIITQQHIYIIQLEHKLECLKYVNEGLLLGRKDVVY